MRYLDTLINPMWVQAGGVTRGVWHGARGYDGKAIRIGDEAIGHFQEIAEKFRNEDQPSLLSALGIIPSTTTSQHRPLPLLGQVSGNLLGAPYIADL